MAEQPSKPQTGSVEDEARRLLEKITPGDWTCRKELRDWNECVHYMIHTVEKLPEHPHSQRFIAWMCGSLGETTRHHWNERQKQDMGWRDDPAIEADAEFIAAAPRIIRALLAEREAAPCPRCGVAMQTVCLGPNCGIGLSQEGSPR